MTVRDRTVALVVVLIVMIGAFTFLVYKPKRGEAAKLGQQVSTQNARITAAKAELAGYEQARSGYRANYANLARLGKAVPAAKDIPSLLVQLDDTSKRSKVDFISITPSAVTAGAAAPASAAPAPAAPAPVGGAPVAAVAAPVGPVALPTLPLTFKFTGSFFRLADFFGRLDDQVVSERLKVQVSGRLLTVDAIELTPASQGFPFMDANVTATSYLAPAAEGVLAGASPVAPAPGVTAQPASTAPAPTAPASPAPATATGVKP